MTDRAARFHALALDPMCTIDRAGQLGDLNDAWVGLIGDRRELDGTPLLDLLDPSAHAAATRALDLAWGTDDPVGFEAGMAPGIAARWVAFTARRGGDDRLYARARDIGGWHGGVGRDQELDRYRRMVDGAGDAIFVHDIQGRIFDASRHAAESLGYDLSELLTMRVVDFEAEFKPGASWGKMIPGKTVTLRGTNVRRDGSRFPVEIRAERVGDGSEDDLWVAVVRDITERVEARKRLERLNVELERARDRAVAASRSKSVFLANMSHELRTPLNAIIGYTELLKEDLEDHEEAVDDLDKVYAAANHLLALINDILDLSKIEAGRMELYRETFGVADMIGGVATTVTPLVKRNHNALVLDVAPDVGALHADRTKVRQVLFNLLSNASKFTENGSITLTVRRRPSGDGDWVVLEVADTGIGIAPEKLETLFEAFAQAHKASRYGGTGLGLAISRHLCRMMGGDLVAQSDVGRGSVFTIRLPAALPEAIELDEPTGPRPVRPGDRVVLVIDDDPEVHILFERHLAPEGYTVVGALTGEDGLRLARELSPAVTLLDVLMPGMDGWTVLTALKADEDTADIPVIIASMAGDQSLGYSLGAAEVLSKPVPRARLLEVLRRYVDAERREVLVVEDEPEVRLMLARLLERDGWTVREAVNGREALDRLQERIPDIVLLDLMMPEVDGFEVIERMRDDPTLADVPVVILSAAEISAAQRLRLHGHVQRILEKGSFDVHGLLAEIRRLARPRTEG